MISAILLLDEQHPDAIDYLLKIDSLLESSGRNFETVAVVNGNGDFLRRRFRDYQHRRPRLRLFETGVHTSRANCLLAVLEKIQGEILLIGGPCQQLTERSMQAIIASIDETSDVIIPVRTNCRRHWFHRFPGRSFGWVISRLSASKLQDFDCDVRVCRKEILEVMNLYGNLFRFLPIYAAEKGFHVQQAAVEALPGQAEPQRFTAGQFLQAIVDILTIFFTTRFTRKPLRFFNAIGTGFAATGMLLLLVLLIQKFAFDVPLGNRPLLFPSLLMTIIGVLVGSTGLLGEIIVFNYSRRQKEYTIEKVL